MGPTPWLTAVFSDKGPNAVELTLAAPGLTGSEVVGRWYFNLNPELNPANLIFTETSFSGIFTTPMALTGADAFKPDYDGKYDILLNFDTPGDLNQRFTGGDSITYNITGIGGLKADDFLFGNTPAAGHEPFYTAASIQTIGEAVILDRVRVPDASQTVILLGFGLLALEGARRRLDTCRCPRG